MEQRVIQDAVNSARGYLEARAPERLAAFARLLCGREPVADFMTRMGQEAESAGFDDTIEILELLDSVDRLDSAVGEACTARLAACQTSDGGWGTEPDEVPRLKLSGRVAGLLAKSPFSPSRSLRQAEAYLTAHWSEARVRAGSLIDIDVYFHWFANHPGELADEALQWCGRELTRGFRGGVIGPVATAQIFTRCGARALPAAPLTAEEVSGRLLEAQREDGSFSDAYVGSDEVATGVALRGIIALA